MQVLSNSKGNEGLKINRTKTTIYIIFVVTSICFAIMANLWHMILITIKGNSLNKGYLVVFSYTIPYDKGWLAIRIFYGEDKDDKVKWLSDYSEMPKKGIAFNTSCFRTWCGNLWIGLLAMCISPSTFDELLLKI